MDDYEKISKLSFDVYLRTWNTTGKHLYIVVVKYEFYTEKAFQNMIGLHVTQLEVIS